MPFFHNKRVLFFLLVDAAVLLGVMGVFASVDPSGRSDPPSLSERVFRTPEPNETNSSSAKGIPETIDRTQPVLGPGTDPLIDLSHYRGRTVQVSTYVVKRGDNFWTIRNDNDIDLHTLIGANPSLPFTASIGEKVNILSENGTLHTVEKGETPASIAKLYKVEEIKIRSDNGINWFHGLKEGDVLFVAGGKPLRMTAEWEKYFGQRGIFGVPFSSWGKGWTSGFGVRTDPITGDKKLHKGMDFKANYGEKVFAASGGRVIFAGVANGYGNLIKIAHGHGYMTFYGHLSFIGVKQGEKVRRGQFIGKVGATGRVTGPHLHFEIRKNGAAIDPLPLI